MIEIGPLRPDDRTAWDVLARGYKAFYRTEVTDDGYQQMWRRLLAGADLYALGARHDGQLIGIVHYLFHPIGWAEDDACYLQDLFVAESARGQGAARALIEAVAAAARDRPASRLYWTTQEDNATARRLYDRLAAFSGFIRYDYPLH